MKRNHAALHDGSDATHVADAHTAVSVPEDEVSGNAGGTGATLVEDVVATAAPATQQTLTKAPNKKHKSKATQPTGLRQEFTIASVRSAALASARGISESLDVDMLFRDARVHLLTTDGASWVFHAPKWYRRIYTHCLTTGQLTERYADWLQRVWNLHPSKPDTIKMFGRDVLTPRFQQAYGQSYRFSGCLFEALPFPEPLLHAIKLLQALVVHPSTGATYFCAGLVNWYAHGDHYLGPHSDDERNIHAQSPILSLSLGATRRFVFTPRVSRVKQQQQEEEDTVVGRSSAELSLQDGDLVVMGGTTQATHKHAVPKMKACAGRRVSVTMRCFK